VPPIMYGTAWKEDSTQALALEAIAAGFRAFDTANQRKHYVEEGVGAAVRTAINSGIVKREELFLQTKFTYQRGQDHRLPYNPDCDLTTQVRQSIASSLEHLGVTRIDSYILHGPSQRSGLSQADWETWRAMEDAADEPGILRHDEAASRSPDWNAAALPTRAWFSSAYPTPAALNKRCAVEPRASPTVQGEKAARRRHSCISAYARDICCTAGTRADVGSGCFVLRRLAKRAPSRSNHTKTLCRALG
jgi:aryl-alcohol dehydrogenase-like predicted oxidoreductase